ncbi:MAG TPA: tRNA threonylcarbamoyladenosine dehydratase [Victivallales bacterium]|nr:tRNA threonylcarbamoyladenosine dehydratase [Victivallales bacterium]
MKNINGENTPHEERWNERTLLLLGEDRIAKFANAHVLVAGLGGVGAFASEFLCRAGIGKLSICDFDTVRSSNRNRQLPALTNEEGRLKTDVMGERLKRINPGIELRVLPMRFNEENAFEILSGKYDYVVDAIDSLSPKVFLLHDCVKMGFKVVSSMGAGEKCDPSMVKTVDIEESYKCPLARLVRKRLHKLGVRGGVAVVFSPEDNFSGRKKLKAGEPVGSISYMPALFGIHCAAKVLKDIGGI